MRLIDKMKEATTKYGELIASKEISLTEHQRAVITTMNQLSFGCQQSAVLKLVSALVEIPMDVLTQSIDLPSYTENCVLVVMENISGHGIPTGETVMAVNADKNQFLLANGLIKSMSPTRGNYRVATEAEIEEYFRAAIADLGPAPVATADPVETNPAPEA